MYSNRVMITGLLGNDAESRTTRNNSSFATFSVATKRRRKNRETDEYDSQTIWNRCDLYGPPGGLRAVRRPSARPVVGPMGVSDSCRPPMTLDSRAPSAMGIVRAGYRDRTNQHDAMTPDQLN